jgi:predicted DsbA family dithiol-disulfide isomerase
MRVEIWSDVVCPWCYIGKRNLEAALAGFEHADEVEVVWRSFELDPGAPPLREGPYAQRLARKYRTSPAEAQGMIDRMTAAGARVGLDLRFDRARPGNTFDAHRLLHLGAARGVQDAVKERFLAATFAEGEPIGDRAALARLAGEAGLDPDEVAEVLASGAFADDVRADEDLARRLDVTGVPFFVVDGTRALGGAQPPDILRRVLERAWAEARPRPVVVGGPGPGCDGDACEA